MSTGLVIGLGAASIGTALSLAGWAIYDEFEDRAKTMKKAMDGVPLAPNMPTLGSVQTTFTIGHPSAAPEHPEAAYWGHLGIPEQKYLAVCMAIETIDDKQMFTETQPGFAESVPLPQRLEILKHELKKDAVQSIESRLEKQEELDNHGGERIIITDPRTDMEFQRAVPLIGTNKREYTQAYAGRVPELALQEYEDKLINDVKHQ